MSFTSLGSAFSPSNFRDVLGDITSNQVFGKWTIERTKKKDSKKISDYTWDDINPINPEPLSNVIAEFDSFVSFDFNKENQVTDYPLENGGFISAMKVIKPSEYEVVLVKNGMNFNYAMENFIDNINKYRDGLDLVDIITPFKTYVNCTVYASGYSHYKDKYNNMILMKLKIKEIQSGKVTESGKVRSSSSAPAKDNGSVPMTQVNKATLTTNTVTT